MKTVTMRALTVVAGGLCASVIAHGQVGKITQQDWVTSRADAQRTAWIRSETAKWAKIVKLSGAKPE